MATKGKATLWLVIKDQGRSALKRIGKALSSIVVTAGDVVNAIKFVGQSFAEFALQASKFQDVQRAFTNLAAKQGQDADQMLNKMRELSDGTISDLKLMQQANQALLLGLPVDRFGDMLNIARSSAKATGESMDFMLNSIVTGLGRGSKLMLDNLGIVFDINKAYEEYAAKIGKTASSLTDAEKKQAFINKALAVGTKNAEGAGVAGTSLADTWAQLKAKGENLAIAIGTRLLPAFQKLLQPVLFVADKLNEAFAQETTQSQIKETEEKIKSLKNKVKDLNDELEGKDKKVEGTWYQKAATFMGNTFKRATAFIKQDIRTTNTALESAQAKLDALKAKAEKEKPKLAGPDGTDDTAAESESDRIAKENALIAEQEFFIRQAEQRALFRGTEAQEQEFIRQQEIEAEIFKQNQLLKNEKDFNKKQEILGKKAALQGELIQIKSNKLKVADQRATFSKIATLSSSNNKTLATIGKAAALTQIAIEGPVAVTRAYSAFPPPFNFAAAAAVAAAVSAQAAQVAGIALADGGIVQARSGGTSAIIGEAGKDEAVIPLDDERTQERLGGLGSVNIAFNGPLLGNESDAEQFAVMIDRKLFELRQAGSSIAFDEEIQ